MLNRNDLFSQNSEKSEAKNKNDLPYIWQKDEDLAKAWQIIDRLQPGEIMMICKIPEARRPIFISCIKQRIDVMNDCEFNKDYSKVKKLYIWVKGYKNVILCHLKKESRLQGQHRL